MASTTAKNRQDVDQMSRKDRLYDSLSYSYGKQQEASDRSYDKAISQQDNAMLSRGMQRSSYAGAIRGNLLDQKVNAQNEIGSAMIADYENRLTQLEQQDIENAFRERQFAYQKESDDRNFAYQKESDDQKLAYNYLSTIAAQGGNASDDLLARAGLSRADYDLMKVQPKTSSGGSRRPKNPITDPGNPLDVDGLNNDAENGLSDLIYRAAIRTNSGAQRSGGLGTGVKPTDRIKKG